MCSRGRRAGARASSRAVCGLTLALLGLAVGLAALAAFMAGRALDEDAAQTMAFATIALAELVLVFSIRSGERPAWRAPGNPFLVASVSLSAAFVAAAVYLEPLGAAFGTVPLEPRAAAVVLALAAAPALAAEAGKAVLRCQRLVRNGIRKNPQARSAPALMPRRSQSANLRPCNRGQPEGRRR